MQINKEAECEVVKKKLSKIQKDWIEYFNNKGEKMISAPDIYKVAKEENKGLTQSLVEDFKDSWVVTSSRTVYEKNSLNAEIIHDADSKIVKSKSYKVTIPELNNEAKQDETTEKYLQALFDTKDDIATILKVLKRFDKSKKIYIWSPSQSSRAIKQVSSVGFYFDDFGLDVDGDCWFLINAGFSRGVIVKSAKQTKRN